MIRMKANGADRLRSCIQMLDCFESVMRPALEMGGQTTEAPAQIMLRAFAFGRTTLRTMAAVAGLGDDAQVCLPTLCRPFYELAVRVLWASWTDCGFQRLQSHYAQEHKRWAEKAVKIPLWTQRAKETLNIVNPVLARKDTAGNVFKPAPKIEVALKEIESREIETGIKPAPDEFAFFEYNIVWRGICGPAHAHVVDIARPPADLTHLAVTSGVLATFALVKAMAVQGAPDLESLDHTVDIVGAKIIKITKGDVDLNLDDIQFIWSPRDR